MFCDGYDHIETKLEVVVRAEILPRDFLETTTCDVLKPKFKVLENFTVKKFGQFLKALTVKLSIFKNKRTSHPEILTTGFSNFSQKWEELFLQTKFLPVGSSLGHLSMKKFFPSYLPSWL